MAVQIATAKSLKLTKVQAAYLSSVVAGVSAKGKAFALSPNFDIAAHSRLRSDVVEALRLRGDSYLRRVRLSAGLTGHLAEQFDLRSGAMLSARDLSWSYAAFMRAAEARDEALAIK
jgi:GH15 family glucan-1,4-alpha-glucosidase